MSENKRPEALEKILKLEKQYPEDLIIKQNVHLVYYKVGEVDKAINKLKEIIKINPDEFSNYHNLGIIYEKINKMKEAKYFFIKAVEKNPNADITFTRLGQIFFGEGDYQNSLKAYNSVIEINGKDAYNANLGKGLCLSKLGLKKEAKKILENVVKLKPDRKDTLHALAYLFLDIGMIKEGIHLYRKLEGEVVFSSNHDEVIIY